METVRIRLPKPHIGQMEVKQSTARYKVMACGRRWGKTLDAVREDAEQLIAGRPVAYYAPTYKMLADTWREFKRVLSPLVKDRSETEHRIQLITGGVLDMWSLDNPDAGRGRKYAHVDVDEAGLIANLEEAWTESIRPQLTDYRGSATFRGTPKGRNFFWRLYCMGIDPEHPDWAAFSMPTVANPYIDPAEVEAARSMLPDRAFRQEYLAEFIEESGGVFRNVVESVDKGRNTNDLYRAGLSYSMGVDLARVEDFTVISVLDGDGRQAYFERFNQISWERQCAAIETVARNYRPRIYLDSTGVGDPIFEELCRRGLMVEGFQFTNNSKEQLINALALNLEQNRLRLMDIPVQSNELMAYQYEITAARHIRMNAPAGMHDDTVIALALANHGLSNCLPVEVSTGARKRETTKWQKM